MSANPEMIFGDASEDELRREAEAAEQRLIASIEEREQGSSGSETDNVNQERATAIEYYLGRPFGNEIEGRSQVVSKDVFDTVEWIKPSLMRIFAGGANVCEFQPQGEEDVDDAKQESDYVDYVIQRKNPWFMLALEWFTDALLTKNAYAMAYWQDQSEPVLEKYKGLTDDQLALIGMDTAVQIVAHYAYQAPQPIPHEVALNAMAQGIQLALNPITLHDVDVRRVKEYGCAKILILPPERCLVAQDARGVSVREHADFFEYWEYKTISELRTHGLDIPDDISDNGGIEKGVVDDVRDSLTTQSFPGEQDSKADPSMRKVKARMIWIRNDYDGDGIAEMRYVIAIGRNVLINQEVSAIPVASIVPYPMPHRHIGLSMYDVLADLQIIKSAMLRAGIDNQYLANNGRTGVDKNLVNLDDMLVSRPGGVVRVNGSPAAALMPFVHPNTVSGTIEMINYLDGIRQDRGGVSKPYAGADIESINAQPGTIAQLTSAASQKIELIARIFGEGVKELFQIVHEVTLQNPTVVEKVELRGKWVSIDPRTWKKRSDMTLSVGMGIGNRQQNVVAIQALLALQKEALPVGLTTLSKLYNGLSEYAKALGYASGAQFFEEPQEGEQFQPQTEYQVQVAQIKAQSELLVQQMKNHTEQAVTQLKEEAAAARTFFEERMEQQRQRDELMVRMFSEQTDRIQEARLNGVSAPKIKIAGLEGFSEAVKGATESAKQAAENATAASIAAAEVRDKVAAIPPRAKKREVTSPSGKKYTVEDK